MAMRFSRGFNVVEAGAASDGASFRAARIVEDDIQTLAFSRTQTFIGVVNQSFRANSRFDFFNRALLPK
jgi:hypothetical protein